MSDVEVKHDLFYQVQVYRNPNSYNGGWVNETGSKHTNLDHAIKSLKVTRERWPLNKWLLVEIENIVNKTVVG